MYLKAANGHYLTSGATPAADRVTGGVGVHVTDESSIPQIEEEGLLAMGRNAVQFALGHPADRQFLLLQFFVNL